ncbi:biliverdin-producing heme oxygenase [Virgisporangium aliadipatigenens]|uniref:biliverdin-producing heme oxygenase n=1 Tax=Virgisporangium aliadipatigenens TaxID=741659 RepID=UPI0019436280|nr:biliverdin-producing heme oxygenase [Virgisporangium aliadipatigenens]
MPAFSAILREQTRSEHRHAETTPYADALARGQVDRAGFAMLVRQHHAIYEALESASDALRDDAVAGPFVIDELRRLPALVVDLHAAHGADWATLPVLPATAEYVAAIEATVEAPHRFIAHHYVRYLGDLSGGQIVMRMLERAGLGGAASFYVFDGIPHKPHFKARYRGLLDEAPLSDAQRAEVIGEARAAFRHNSAVFHDLGGFIPQAA